MHVFVVNSYPKVCAILQDTQMLTIVKLVNNITS